MMQSQTSLDERRFTLGEACVFAGANPRRVTVWYQRERLSLGELVSPKKRLLSLWETVHLALVERLANLTTIDNAAAWAEHAMSDIRTRVEERKLSLTDDAAAVVAWATPLALFIEDEPHEFNSRQPTLPKPHVTDAVHSLEWAAKHHASGIGTVAFIFVPVGLLLSAMYKEMSKATNQ